MNQERFRLVIVEDSPTIQQSYREILGGSYDLQFAEEALGALRLIAAERPDVVILDVNLKDPDRSALPAGAPPPKRMTGLDICAAIKRSPFKNIPVIMLTTRTGIIDRMRGKFAHADLYLSKPIDEPTLTHALRTFLYERIVVNRMELVVNGLGAQRQAQRSGMLKQ